MHYEELVLPSGIRVTSVSTRDDPAAFNNRGWQKSVGEPNPSSCKMELESQPEQVVPGLSRGGYHVRRHPKPYSEPTFVVTPNSCAGWTEGKVRSLGGVGQIATVIKLAGELSDMLVPDQERLVLVHAEASNEPVVDCHLKWHVLNYPGDQGEMAKTEAFARQLPFQVLENADITAVLGGCLDGQLFLYSPKRQGFSKVVESLAAALDQAIALYAKKFKSTQGVPPDFSALISIAPGGKFRFATYLPKLRHIGVLEWVVGVTAGGQMGVNCSIATMHRYLTEE